MEIDTLFQTKTAHTYIAYIREYPPGVGGGGKKRVADYESRCLRKRD